VLRILRILFVIVLLFTTSLQQPRISAQVMDDRPQRNENEDWLTKQQREQARLRNLERQQKLKRDTDHLVELATELKQYVDRSNENLLSVDVVKKCEEIEKLAKDVKNKMKGT
jgi:hypothetical protein